MKRIRRHIYYVEQLKKVDGEIQSVTNEDGSLFSGVYKTKIFPEDLPEWYKQDRYYKRLGYMSTQGIVDMVYIPSQLGTFLKDDVLLVSYVNKIAQLHQRTGRSRLRGTIRRTNHNPAGCRIPSLPAAHERPARGSLCSRQPAAVR